MAGLRQFIAGNWKMNGLRASLVEVEQVKAGIGGTKCEVAICPPATLIAAAVATAAGSALLIGGQDCDSSASGAHTGDISAEMIADAGGKLVIVGHSERRTDHSETDAMVRAKAEAAWRARLLPVLCVGETAAQRDVGATLDVLEQQLWGSVPNDTGPEKLVIAYEPVWAIGTGLTPSATDIAEAHAHIRARLTDRFGPVAAAIRILYGGSVKPSNAKEILALDDVDGALVGGASLRAADFLGIIGGAR
jgi:triosephosphate isomerase (TIM)